MIKLMMKRYIFWMLLGTGMLVLPAAQAQRSKKAKTKTTNQKKVTPKPAARSNTTVTTNNRTDDTTIRSTTLEVYQVYKPEIKIAPKPSIIPTLAPPETTTTPQQYDVPQQSLFYTYRSLPLRPLALGKDTAKLPTQNYVKGGGGNLNTLFGDLGIGSLRGDNWETAIHAHFISQHGKIPDQQYLHTGLEAAGSLKSDNHLWKAGVTADYHKYNHYGYDHRLYDFDTAPKIGYTSIEGHVGVSNISTGIWGLDYAPSLMLKHFTAGSLGHETTVEATLPFSKKLDSNLTFELGLKATYTGYNSGNISGDNNIFKILPGISYRIDVFSAHLGLYPTFGRGGNSYLLPDITASYQVSTKFNILAGWQADLQQNTFQQQSLKNPFYTKFTSLPQSRNDEVYLGINAGIGHHLSIGTRGSWWQYNNLPEFITYSGDTAGRFFDVLIAPKVNALSLQVSARYEVGTSFSVGLSGAWYSYYNKVYAKVWQEPSVRFKGDVQWNILKNLQANAYLAALSGLYGQDAFGTQRKMKDIIDVGAGGEYQLIPQLSIWLNVGNLLNRPNQRWLGYDAFGINVYGGIRFRF